MRASKVLVWDWYDGPTIGFAEGSGSKQIYYFKIPDDYFSGREYLKSKRRYQFFDTGLVDLDAQCALWFPGGKCEWPIWMPATGVTTDQSFINLLTEAPKGQVVKYEALVEPAAQNG